MGTPHTQNSRERRSIAGVHLIVTGVDIIEISRIQKTVNRWGSRFLNRIYTESELWHCGQKASRLATRFAAKEATMKALGTGVNGINWKDIEVLRGRDTPPGITLHGNASKRARHLGIQGISVSLAHTKEYAVASVVAYSSTEK